MSYVPENAPLDQPSAKALLVRPDEGHHDPNGHSTGPPADSGRPRGCPRGPGGGRRPTHGGRSTGTGNLCRLAGVGPVRDLERGATSRRQCTAGAPVAPLPSLRRPRLRPSGGTARLKVVLRVRQLITRHFDSSRVDYRLSSGGDLGSTGVGKPRLRARDPGYSKTPGLLKRRRTSSTGCLRATTSHRLAPVGLAEATQIGISGGERAGATDENQRASCRASCSWESRRRKQITKLRT